MIKIKIIQSDDVKKFEEQLNNWLSEDWKISEIQPYTMRTNDPYASRYCIMIKKEDKNESKLF